MLSSCGQPIKIILVTSLPEHVAKTVCVVTCIATNVCSLHMLPLDFRVTHSGVSNSERKMVSQSCGLRGKTLDSIQLISLQPQPGKASLTISTKEQVHGTCFKLSFPLPDFHGFNNSIFIQLVATDNCGLF
ncbi:hypothetical protein V6N13_119557 [Hibiscus sabdariffa]|uniref:Uncharacterized protein n=1 Tax=Hibiscus sabdariffa TaxID=183260 RepID=A0ABR2E3B0_9ROSI